MGSWLAALQSLDRQGETAVLVTVLAARGSTPREAGCKMVVAADALHGTIGGGNLEYQCIAAAREMLATAATVPMTRDFPLGPALGQCCGGHVSVLFERIAPAVWAIALFGAGHVGQALARLLGELPCRVRWIDPRPLAFPDDCADNIQPITADPAAEVAKLPPGAAVLVMTHDHQLDFDIVAAALARADLPMVGLIGSETKRARFLRRLAQRGLDAAARDRLVCPIGVAGAGGKLPAEIAISAAAQLLQWRDAGATVAVRKPAPRLNLARLHPVGCDNAACACTKTAVAR